MNVLVVIPAYNEQDCIGAVVASVVGAGLACVVIDDASGDGTASIAAAAGATVVRLPINLGVGGALRTGWRYAIDHGFDTVVQIDGDGQHDVESIEALLTTLGARGLDMVIGSRFADGGAHDGMSRMRRACIRLLSRALRRSAGVTVSDPTSGLRAITTPLLDAFASDFPHHYLGDTFEAALVAGRRRYRVGEVAVTMRSRQGGAPSADLFASARAMVRALTILVTGASFDLPTRPD